MTDLELIEMIKNGNLAYELDQTNDFVKKH